MKEKIKDKREHIKADVDENKLNIEVSSQFYPQSVVLEVAQRFTDRFWAEVNKEDERLLVKIEPKKELEREDLQQLGRRFMNHVLSEVQER